MIFLKNAKRVAVFFASGGMGYAIIEILWRGKTHWTMIIAGGICFVIFSLVAEKLKKRTAVCKAAVCSLGVTAVEFIFGVVFNLLLKMNVWDYSGVRFNILGQVCPLYSLLWALLALGVLPLAELINKKLRV